MAERIVLGSFPEESLDLDTLIETRLLIQANSGGGKSYTIRRLLEQTHGRVQHLVIDVEGDFGTLREKFDYALVGPDGDCPADPRTAGPLVQKLMEIGLSAIVDISELTDVQRDEFVAEFLTQLMRTPKAQWRPLLVVVDEAHKSCPEAETTKSKPQVIDLMTRGRKRGFCGVLATQRVALLSKSAVAEANNKLVGRCLLDVDIRRVADDLSFSKAQRQTLRTLSPGHFYAIGPAICAEAKLVVIGKVQTLHPKAGSRAVAPPPAPKAIAKALASLAKIQPPVADDVEAADQTRGYPLLDELRARVAELEQELRERGEQPSEPACDAEALSKLDEITERMNAIEAALRSCYEMLESRVEPEMTSCWNALEELRSSLRGTRPDAPAGVGPGKTSEVTFSQRPRTASKAGQEPRPGASALPKIERLVLTALAQFQGGEMSRARLALLIGYHQNAKSFCNGLGALRSRGAVDGLAITTTGLEELGPYDKLPATVSARIDWWCNNKLDGVQGRILREIARSPGHTRDSLAAAVNYHPNAKSFTNGLGRLRGLHLVEGLRLSKELRG